MQNTCWDHWQRPLTKQSVGNHKRISMFFFFNPLSYTVTIKEVAEQRESTAQIPSQRHRVKPKCCIVESQSEVTSSLVFRALAWSTAALSALPVVKNITYLRWRIMHTDSGAKTNKYSCICADKSAGMRNGIWSPLGLNYRLLYSFVMISFS